MSIHRGAEPLPIGDGSRDRVPAMARCNVCLKIRNCYVGGVLAYMPAPRGEPFAITARYCRPCLESMIDTALHQ